MSGVRFCLIAAPRTGSEHLCAALHSHPQIVCHRELFNPQHFVAAMPPAMSAALPSIADRDADPLATLERVMALSQQVFPRRHAIGFKFFLAHAPQVLDAVVSGEAWRLVVLRRRDRLAQYTSLQIARETGRWNAYRADAPSGQHRVDVDLARFARFCEKLDREEARLDRRLCGRHGVFLLASEDIDARLPELLGFLDADPGLPLSSSRRRQNSPRIEERIRNWDAIAPILLAEAVS